jgi:hypothetical protein
MNVGVSAVAALATAEDGHATLLAGSSIAPASMGERHPDLAASARLHRLLRIARSGSKARVLRLPGFAYGFDRLPAGVAALIVEANARRGRGKPAAGG